MLDRRSLIAVCSRFGLATTLFPGTLWALSAQKDAEPKSAEQKDTAQKDTAQKDAAPKPAEPRIPVTRDMIDHAAAMAGVYIADEYKDMMLDSLNGYVKGYDAVYALHIPNQVAPALVFDPVPSGMKLSTLVRPMKLSSALIAHAPAVHTSAAPKNIEDVAFHSVPQLAELVRSKKVSSTALTQMYLERLKRYDPTLKFVISFTEDRALAKAKEADREIAAGKYRGPLHSLHWGAKDLLSVTGTKTYWSALGSTTHVILVRVSVIQRINSPLS